ncbi:DgyrCDS4385 [Dimorphilus gyrociliatus]|uniref:DgyrCDS4385 n=1 Tax=Dimorphilus gyrociliatus TaxID=2664684 RepID=A0A7I8VIA4_9ANNE|nr:DgyrCDS4385 [Dimorphilus gyrociliatus]
MADSDDEHMFDAHPEEDEDDDDHIRSLEPEPETEDPEAVLAECVTCFESKDFIMESNVFQQLQQYFTAGGSPDTAVDLLSSNYSALAQMANFLAELQIMAGIDIKEVQDVVENHLKSMIIKYFDPKRADSIFTDEGEPPAWLAELINYPTWRHLVYELAEEFPDCLMLNFTIKLISDAGYQGEITSVSTACHQIEVFSRVLKTTLSEILLGGEAKMKTMLSEFAKMICHGEHTYLYSQVLMQALCDDVKGSATMRRLCQEVEKIAKERGYDVTPISLGLSGAAVYKQACTALSSMLCRNALNPADISTLYKVFTSSDPPPVSLLRSPSLLGLFMESLFKPGAKVNPEHKGKYIFLLAYASTVAEVWRRVSKPIIKLRRLSLYNYAVRSSFDTYYLSVKC